MFTEIPRLLYITLVTRSEWLYELSFRGSATTEESLWRYFIGVENPTYNLQNR